MSDDSPEKEPGSSGSREADTESDRERRSVDRRVTDVEGHDRPRDMADHRRVDETPEPISADQSPFSDTDEETTADVPPEEFESFTAEHAQIPSLVVLTGARAGETTRVDQDGETLLGRHRDRVDIWFRDGGVSRRHAAVELTDRGAEIRDLDSSNGTFVNGDRIDGRRRLQEGDKIALGNRAILKFTLNDELDEKFQRQMYESSISDELTGVYSRAYLEEQMRSEMAFADRHDTEIALLLFDLDDFKQINDTRGHVAGDKILVELADLVDDRIRTEDLVARYGGDEFAVLLRDTDPETAREVGERIRRSVEQRDFRVDDDVVELTISVGASIYSPAMMRDVEDWVGAADEALYEAKEAGRNCLRVRTRPLPDDGAVTETYS